MDLCSEGGVDVIYLDYQKAFDTVPIKRLMQKLKGYGVRGAVAKLLEDLLTGRKIESRSERIIL